VLILLFSSKSVRNLKDYFKQRFSVRPVENPAWRKIDCNVILPRHKFFKIMPATFRPKPCSGYFKARPIPMKPKREFLPKNSSEFSKRSDRTTYEFRNFLICLWYNSFHWEFFSGFPTKKKTKNKKKKNGQKNNRNLANRGE